MKRQLIALAEGYIYDPRHWLQNILWRYPATISERSVVFIVGAPRSGTTLLQRILSVHPGFFSIEGETGLFSYQNIFVRRHFNFDKDTLERLFSESVDVIDFFDKSVAVLERYNAAKIFVEKTPQHINYVSFLARHFPNAKFIHIYRDGRDCYLSALEHPHIPQNRTLKCFAKYWKKCVSSWIPVRSLGNAFEIKYEDLASQPEVEVAKLMKYLGSRFVAEQLDPKYLAKDVRANRDVFRKLNLPIDSSSCFRWKAGLTREENEQFISVAGGQLEAYGYVLREM
jgi:hypothetical protein